MYPPKNENSDFTCVYYFEKNFRSIMIEITEKNLEITVAKIIFCVDSMHLFSNLHFLHCPNI